MDSRYPTLTADETRAAEQVIFDRGVPVIDLMEKAGAAVADAIRANCAPDGALVLAGPGNNGGDGYVVARLLQEAGWRARIAALANPATEPSRIACERWAGPVEDIAQAEPAPILIDALFGTGLTRPLDPIVTRRLFELADAADHRIAIDLPSGIATDDGKLLNDVPQFDLTVALGVYKPAHSQGPGADRCGKVFVGDIGLVEAAREAGLC